MDNGIGESEQPRTLFLIYQKKFGTSMVLLKSDDETERKRGIALLTEVAQVFAKIANNALWELEQSRRIKS